MRVSSPNKPFIVSANAPPVRVSAPVSLYSYGLVFVLISIEASVSALKSKFTPPLLLNLTFNIVPEAALLSRKVLFPPSIISSSKSFDTFDQYSYQLLIVKVS